MIPSGLSNTNRVKSIKSKFEVLNDRGKCGDGEADPRLRLQAVTTVPLNLKKVNISMKNVTYKPQTHKQNNDSPVKEHLTTHNLFETDVSDTRGPLGASSNFGNRKRLKEKDFNGDYLPSESHNTTNARSNVIDSYVASQDVRCNSATDSISYDDAKENMAFKGTQRSLSRHHSDPIKKLHRSPAFRCDRSEKLKDSRKNSFNSDTSDHILPPMEADRCRLSRDRLKRLGHLLEEKMKQDDFEFSKPKNKLSGFKIKDVNIDSNSSKLPTTSVEIFNLKMHSDKTNPEKSLQVIKDKLKPIVYSGVLKNNKTDDANNIHETINDDLQIPQHILDQYAQVIKPKNRNAFARKSSTAKIDVVLSDSGVSSESENLISDDLDDSETSPKIKNFKAIRSNFEPKNNNSQGREDLPNRRKFLRRSSEDKSVSNNVTNNKSSSKEYLIDNDALNPPEPSYVKSFDNKTFVDKSNESLSIAPSDTVNDVGLSDTLKKVLKQPLPPGPPPKKPPRTFAAAMSNSQTERTETSNTFSEQTKSKIKDGKSKSGKSRTKEESKIMLNKIENALYRHENGGKILSPRPLRKDGHNNSSISVADSWTRQGTKPSTAKLKKSYKKGDSSKDSKPEELHYMCTEILDLNCPESENILDSSSASLNSGDSLQTTNSFTKCFNSLNCANGSLRNSSSVNYAKLDSLPNSRKTSLNNVCCSCSFSSPKDKLGSSRSSIDEFSLSNQPRRLSTFLPSPSKSIENLSVSQNTCETCGSNPTDQFVCHINSSNLSNRSFSPQEFVDEPKSVFFVDRKYDSRSESSSNYGVLKKSKSQEHIYAEPYECIKFAAQNMGMEDKKVIPKSKSSVNVPLSNKSTPIKPPPLIRMRTQLEDGFGRFREVDETKILSSDPRIQNNSLSTFTTQSVKKFDIGMIDNSQSGPSAKRLDTSSNKEHKTDSVAPSIHCTNVSDGEPNKGSKVKDILMRLEGGRASLRLDSYKRNDNARKSLVLRPNIRNSVDLSSLGVFEISDITASPSFTPTRDLSTKLSHVLNSKIYDTPELDNNSEVKKQDMDPHNSEQVHLTGNTSFLYGLEKPKPTNHTEEHAAKKTVQNGIKIDNDFNGDIFKRPPIFEKKTMTVQTNSIKAKRPQSLYLIDNGRVSTAKGVTFSESRRRRSPTEVDKENLSRLMTEIYDTVAEACILEGNAPTAASGDSEHDTSDEVSLKLTRSLTEKRKRYVRRVTSRVGFLSEDRAKVQRQDSVDDDDIPDNEGETNFKAYSTFPSRQSIKNASFLHSNINKESKMSEESSRGKEGPAVQECKKETIIKGGGLFEACILVGMNFSTGQAYIKSVYPEMVVVPPQIESLVFPESVAANTSGDANRPNSRPVRISDEAQDVQCYTLVLTNEKGLRTYAYCRRVLPEGATHCLPLTYCMISRHRAPSFYYKILQELESRHGSSDDIVNAVLDQLYGAEFPKPGFSVTLKQVRSPKRLVVHDGAFKKSSPYRNSVNLGDVLKSGSYEGLSGVTSLNSSSQSLLVDKDGDKFRRKSSGHSSNFPELRPDLSVMKSLEKIYGENLKEFKSDLVDRSEPTESISGATSIDRELGSRGSNVNIKRSCDNSTENLPSESSEGYRNDSSSQEADTEERFTKEYQYSIRNDVVQIKRPLEPRLDEDNLSVLFESISVSTLVKIFGTLIIERKVVLICDKLSQLSACIEALQSILYPLTWQHTLVSSIPRDMTRDILEAPIPILAGLLLPLSATSSKQQHPELDKIYFDEGMLIDISNGEERLIKVQGDESTLLPPLLSKTLKASLQLGPPITTPSSPSDEHARKTRNVLVAEAFLRFFVEVLGDCKKYFVDEPGSPIGGIKGKYKFEKEQFIKSFRSKHVQYFLEWFTETAMFNTYIQQRMLLMTIEQPSILSKSEPLGTAMLDLPYPDFYEMFDERVSRRGTSQSARAQLSNIGKDGASKGNYKTIMNKKVKVWRDKLRDLVS